MGILIAFHVIVSILLIGIILVQRGRGGGFVDSFQNLESVFGTKTSSFLTRSTSVLAVLFFMSCLVLAFISLRQSRSLIRAVPPPAAAENATGQAAGPEQKEGKSEPSAQPGASQSAPQEESRQQGAAGNVTEPAK